MLSVSFSTNRELRTAQSYLTKAPRALLEVVPALAAIVGLAEEKQLRLALGQVLRYAHQLEAKGKVVRGVLAVERRPQDRSWAELCTRLGGHVSVARSVR
jgi:hypothetical protein